MQKPYGWDHSKIPVVERVPCSTILKQYRYNEHSCELEEIPPVDLQDIIDSGKESTFSAILDRFLTPSLYPDDRITMSDFLFDKLDAMCEAKKAEYEVREEMKDRLPKDCTMDQLMEIIRKEAQAAYRQNAVSGSQDPATSVVQDAQKGE